MVPVLRVVTVLLLLMWGLVVVVDVVAVVEAAAAGSGDGVWVGGGRSGREEGFMQCPWS
jgi:hypothetical protein